MKLNINCSNPFGFRFCKKKKQQKRKTNQSTSRFYLNEHPCPIKIQLLPVFWSLPKNYVFVSLFLHFFFCFSLGSQLHSNFFHLSIVLSINLWNKKKNSSMKISFLNLSFFKVFFFQKRKPKGWNGLL